MLLEEPEPDENAPPRTKQRLAPPAATLAATPRGHTASTAAALAAALATPSPARALAMYPSLAADYAAYCGALRGGCAPMPLPAFVQMSLATGSGGLGDAAAPRMHASLLADTPQR